MAKKAYLSGQITNLSEDEFRANFDRAAELVRSHDYEPVNPLEVEVCNDKRCGGGATLADGSQMHAYDCYMKHDIKAELDCDIVVMLPNWKNSSGAAFERDVAIKCGIPVWYIEAGYGRIYQ